MPRAPVYKNTNILHKYKEKQQQTWGAFFWDYSGYSYSGLGITEYTEFQFRKERNSGNGIPMAEVT